MKEKIYRPYLRQCTECKRGHITVAVHRDWEERRDEAKTEEQLRSSIEPPLPWQNDGCCHDLPFWTMPKATKGKRFWNETERSEQIVECMLFERIEETRWESIK